MFNTSPYNVHVCKRALEELKRPRRPWLRVKAAAAAVGLLFIQKQPGADKGRLLFLAAQTTTVFPGSLS